jgi:copper chaperone NosL
MKGYFKPALKILLLAAALLSACSSQPEGPRPPEILYEQDVCVSCGMIISEARFAAATVLTDGEGRKFDDIAEMLVYHMEHPTEQVAAWFVHDYEDEHWIRAETAYFVHSDALKSPMGGNIVAFEDETAANALAAELQGEVYTLDQLRADVHMEVHE